MNTQRRLGRGLAALMVMAFDTELYRFPLVISPRTYAFAATTTIAATIVSALVVRRRLDTLDLVEPLRMDSAEKVTLAPAVIEERPALRIAGMSDHFTFKTMDTIPHLWQRFGPFIPELERGAPVPVFGVTGRMPEGSDGFDYFAAGPLPKGEDLIPGLTEMMLPAGTYAKFKHEGHISGIRATCGAVYETGIPSLGREPDTRWFSFIEYYGPDFEPSTGTGTVEIWVKLKD